MTLVASGQGGLIARVQPERGDELVAAGEAELVVMRGRPMRGWLRIPRTDVATEHALSRWVNLSLAFVRALPAK